MVVKLEWSGGGDPDPTVRHIQLNQTNNVCTYMAIAIAKTNGVHRLVSFCHTNVSKVCYWNNNNIIVELKTGTHFSSSSVACTTIIIIIKMFMSDLAHVESTSEWAELSGETIKKMFVTVTISSPTSTSWYPKINKQSCNVKCKWQQQKQQYGNMFMFRRDGD